MVTYTKSLSILVSSTFQAALTGLTSSSLAQLVTRSQFKLPSLSVTDGKQLSIIISINLPCAVACINICEHVEDPAVHVKSSVDYRYTMKHPACTVGWVVQLCHSWLSFPWEKPHRDSTGVTSKTKKKLFFFFFFKL